MRLSSPTDPLSSSVQDSSGTNIRDCVILDDRLRVGWLNGFSFLWEGYRESRRCSRDTYPESCITNYTSAGRRVQGSGFRVQGTGRRVQGAGCRVQGTGCRARGAGFRVQGSGFRVQGSGFMVHGAGCRVQGGWG